MIHEFLDSPSVSQHEAFQAWRREHEHGFFLAFQNRANAKLHVNGGCHHPGDPFWTVTEEAASLTRKRKVASTELDELVAWANQERISWSWCADCERETSRGGTDNPRQTDSGHAPSLTRLRQTVGYAAAVFDRICGRKNVEACATLLADAITTAVATEGAWSVTVHEKNVLLNAGPIRVLNLSEGSVWFATTEAVGDVPGWVEELSAKRTTEHLYSSVPVVTRDFMMASARVVDVPPLMREAFLAYVAEAAARRRGRSLFAASHSVGAVAFLNELLGQNLPVPSAAVSQEDPYEEPQYFEGRRRVFTLEVKERDPAARAACINAHGTRCAACGMSFGERYGKIGEGFIEVHHLKKLADAHGERSVDPIRDLVPVCSNCHRMLHREDPVLTPEELAERIISAEVKRP